MKFPIYLDYHATTPVDPRVVDTMIPFFNQHFGNAASLSHSYGWIPNNAVEDARKQVADLIGADSHEIVFTSGATEALNLAIKGIAEMHEKKGDHIIAVVTEHKAVLDTCKHLQKLGKRITYLPVNNYGIVDIDLLKSSITDKTILVCVMYANNEIGTIQDIARIGSICRERGIYFLTDATQSIGKIPCNVEDLNIDLATLSAHKIYGPKGIGALYVRKHNPRVQLIGQIDGGGHENNLRSGTLNVPGIVGLGKAADICKAEINTESQRIKFLRDKLYNELQNELGEIQLNGHPTNRLPGNVNVSFNGISSELLMHEMKDIAVSAGAACISETLEVSYVLKAIGLSVESAKSAIRFGLGRFTTEEEIDYTIDHIIKAVKKLRYAASKVKSESCPIQQP